MPSEDFLRLVGQIGLAVTLVIALWYVILTPRKTPDGKRKSSLLVPGWIHDDAIAERERVRSFYEAALKTSQELVDARVKEWRGLRDEEVARRVDAEADRVALLEAVKGLSDDIQILIELQRMELPLSDHKNPGAVTRIARKRSGK